MSISRLASVAAATAAALVLGACASSTARPAAEAPAAPVPVAATTPVQPAPSALYRMIGRAGRVDAPSLAMVEQALGAPDVARQEGAGAIVTYRTETCALVFVFTADPRNELRLTEAQSLPRRVGETAAPMEACVAAAEARRRG